MKKTKIEWTDRTWNPITGCTKCSPGCQNCYAERMSKRLRGRFGYPADEPFRVTMHPDRLLEPMGWSKSARIFVCSMSDLFHGEIPDAFRDQVFAVMARATRHTFMLLTKRPEQMRSYVRSVHLRGWLTRACEEPGWSAKTAEFASRLIRQGLPNVWLGVTAENQEQADKRIPILLDTPAAVRFVSVEPMLEPVDLTTIRHGDDPDLPVLGTEWGPDWIICGGETGPGARPMDPAWARSLRDQCKADGVPFFMKKMAGGGQPPEALMIREFPEVSI